MAELNNYLDELPVLTEFAAPGQIAPATPSAGPVVAELSVFDPDPGGYDPYNNAPPVPADKQRYSVANSPAF